MKWQKKLTKKELKHIKETTDSCTLREFKINRRTQIKMDKKSPGLESCLDCKFIAKKLEVD